MIDNDIESDDEQINISVAFMRSEVMEATNNRGIS